jgi:hypothetical protein
VDELLRNQQIVDVAVVVLEAPHGWGVEILETQGNPTK